MKKGAVSRLPFFVVFILYFCRSKNESYEEGFISVLLGRNLRNWL